VQPSSAGPCNIFADLIEVAFPELFIEIVIKIFIANPVIECVPTATPKLPKPSGARADSFQKGIAADSHKRAACRLGIRTEDPR
jgi:hypothetical protein